MVKPTWRSWSVLSLIKQRANRSWLGLIAVILPGNGSPSILQTMYVCVPAQSLQQLGANPGLGMLRRGRTECEQVGMQGTTWFVCPNPQCFVFSIFWDIFECIFLIKCFGLWNRCRVFSTSSMAWNKCRDFKKCWTLRTTSVAVQGAKEMCWCLPLDIPVFPVCYLSYLVPKSPSCPGLQQILLLVRAEEQEKQDLLLGGILGIKGSGWDVSETVADLGPFWNNCGFFWYFLILGQGPQRGPRWSQCSFLFPCAWSSLLQSSLKGKSYFFLVLCQIICVNWIITLGFFCLVVRGRWQDGKF